MKITAETVRERIAALEAAGELSIKEQFYLDAMRELLPTLTPQESVLKQHDGFEAWWESEKYDQKLKNVQGVMFNRVKNAALKAWVAAGKIASKPADASHAQFKPVADLYALKTLAGQTYNYTASPHEAEQWLGTEGYSVQEYVKLERLQQAVTAPPAQGGTDYKAIVERIAEILHGKVTDIDLLTVTVQAMKERNSKLERQREAQPALRERAEPVADEIVGWVREDDGDARDPLFLCGSVHPKNGRAYNSSYYPVKRAAMLNQVQPVAETDTTSQQYGSLAKDGE